MRTLNCILSSSVAALLLGCVSPVGQMYRSDVSIGDGPLIANCQNLASQYREEAFVTEFYLTTWSSALQEGAQEGIRTALDDQRTINTPGNTYLRQLLDTNLGRRDTIARLLSSPTANWRIKTITLFSLPKPVCRRYLSRSKDVSRALVRTLSRIENKLIVSDGNWGVFETDFRERKKGNVRWRDRYVVFVDQDDEDGSIVRVFRDIYIDRSGSMFNQAISSGQNEAWILTQIQDEVRSSTASSVRGRIEN